MAPLDLFQGEDQTIRGWIIRQACPIRRRRPADAWREILEVDGVVAAEGGCPFEGIAEFADVARKGVRTQAIKGRGGDGEGRTVELVGELTQEGNGQEVEVIASVGGAGAVSSPAGQRAAAGNV